MLYIEDNAINFASVDLRLRSKRALKVLQATSGKPGIALAQTHDPKLILLDLDLPDIGESLRFQRAADTPRAGRKPPASVVLHGEIPYSPHRCVAPALLHLTHAQSSSAK